jgi:hypothetical protein
MKFLILILTIAFVSFSQIGKNDMVHHVKISPDSTKIKLFYVHYPAGPFMGGGPDSVYPYMIVYKAKNGKIVPDTTKVWTRTPSVTTPEVMNWGE